MRLIDADALEKTLEKLWNIHDDQDFCNKDVWREIENAQTVEPKERTAKVGTAEKQIEGSDRTITVTACGNCGTVVSIFDNYCAGCGCRLEWK